MQKYNFKVYLEEQKKLDYELSREEYVTGQTWCILKRQHVCLYFSVLFFLGIILELYEWASKGKWTNAFLLSVLSVILFVFTLVRVKKSASQLFETEPHRFFITYEKKGFVLKNIETGQSIFYSWNMIRKEKKIKHLWVVFITGNVYFFVPEHRDKNAETQEKTSC